MDRREKIIEILCQECMAPCAQDGLGEGEDRQECVGATADRIMEIQNPDFSWGMTSEAGGKDPFSSVEWGTDQSFIQRIAPTPGRIKNVYSNWFGDHEAWGENELEVGDEFTVDLTTGQVRKYRKPARRRHWLWFWGYEPRPRVARVLAGLVFGAFALALVWVIYVNVAD